MREKSWGDDASRAWRRAIPLLALALLTGIVRGADGQPPDPAASNPAVQLFTGGRVIVGDGRVIEDAAFLVRGDLIVRVGNAGEVPAPPEASVVDLTGRTVMPALVNTHAHLGWERYTSWGSENFTRENLIDHLDRHAYYGVGTIISTGSDVEEIALEVRQAQRVGEVEGARYLVSPGLGIPGGGPNPRFTNDAGWWGLHGVTSPAEAREVVRAEAARGIRILKIWVDARDERRGARVKLHPDIYAAILDEAQVRDMRVIAHATTLEDHQAADRGRRPALHPHALRRGCRRRVSRARPRRATSSSCRPSAWSPGASRTGGRCTRTPSSRSRSRRRSWRCCGRPRPATPAPPARGPPRTNRGRG